MNIHRYPLRQVRALVHRYRLRLPERKARQIDQLTALKTTSPYPGQLRQGTFPCGRGTFPHGAALVPYGSTPFPCGADPVPCGKKAFPYGTIIFPYGKDPFPCVGETLPCGKGTFPVVAVIFPCGGATHPYGNAAFPIGKMAWTSGNGGGALVRMATSHAARPLRGKGLQRALVHPLLLVLHLDHLLAGHGRSAFADGRVLQGARVELMIAFLGLMRAVGQLSSSRPTFLQYGSCPQLGCYGPAFTSSAVEGHPAPR